MIEWADLAYLTPELILVGAASVLIVLDLFFRRKEIVAFAGVLGCLAAIFASATLFVSTDSATVFNGMFVFDGYGSFFKIFFYLTCILTICLSMKYLEVEGIDSVSTTHCCFWPLPAWRSWRRPRT